jgi:site-specific DNA-methyltransferase (adenine-specific)
MSVVSARADSVDRPWLSVPLLSEIYAPSLAAEFSDIEESAEYVDLSLAASDRVNTARSRRDPVAGWVRYREGYSPDLVEMLLAQYEPPLGSVVLDPMCGSGSTQLAAQRRGFVSVGFDINPYAVLASRVKTSLLSANDSEAVARALGHIARGSVERPVGVGVSDGALARYFPPRNLAVLRSLQRWVNHWPAGRVRDFLTLALLSIVEDCSNRRKDGNGLATRPSPVGDPLSLFVERTSAMLRETQEQAAFHAAPATTQLLSAIGFDKSPEAAALALEGNVGAIVFSPPYPNSFDYFESYKLELLFGGLVKEQDFGLQRQAAVRSYRQSGTLPPSDLPLVENLIDAIMAELPRKEALTGTRDGRTRLVPNLLRGYFSDMREVLRSCAAVVTPGGRVHIIVDQSAYAGVAVPTDLILADIGKQTGFALERLAFCRRARTSAQQLRLQPGLQGLLRETIVTLSRC